MDKLAYFKIEEPFTPRDASDVLETAAKSGYKKVILLHEDNADIRRAKYKEKLISVFRAAYRHKVELYVADDSFSNSGTAFGELSSVKDMWQKELVKVKKTDVGEETVLARKGDECIVARYLKDDEKYPYKHYVDLTNPLVARMVIASVYEPLCREYEKFKGYELKGFATINPLWNTEGVVYSKKALEKMGKVDLFALFENGKEYAKYKRCVRSAMEEEYIMPLKAFCREKGLEYLVCGGYNSVSDEVLKKYSRYTVKNNVSSGYLMEADSVKKVIEAARNGMDSVLKINSVMKKLDEVKSFLKKACDECRVYDVYSFKPNGNSFVIANMTNEVKSVGLLLDDWCIVDEKENIYPVKRTTYTFHPYSFIRLVKRTDDMYIEDIPVKIGGVEVGEGEEVCEVEFEKEGNIYGFYLPDITLFDKHISFEGDFEFLRVRMGTMEESLVQKPFCMPLYDFLREARGGAEALGGEISKIVIKG